MLGMRCSILRFSILSASVSTLALAATPAVAQRTEVRSFDIPAQPLSSALLEFSKQSDVMVLVAPGLTEGKRSPALKGTMPVNEAIGRLLRGTRLRAAPNSAGGYVVSAEGNAPAAAAAATGNQAAPSLGEGPEAPTPPKSPDLREIVVTAQKRSERLLDVPVPVAVVDGRSLVKSNELRLQDFFSSVPGLNVTPYIDSSNYLTIRGVTTGIGSNPTVGVTVDGVPYGSSTYIGGGAVVPDLDPGDLARIEVLRGPQGTLYGANSLGGLLNFITVDPSTKNYSGRVEAGASNTHNGAKLGYDIRASANLPLGETAALRISGFTRQDPGYIDNPGNCDGLACTPVKGINEAHVSGGHLSFMFRPSDDWSIKLSALYQRARGDGSSDVDLEPGLNGLQQNYAYGVGGYNRTTQAYSAIVNGSIGSVQVASVTGYNINSFRDSEDLSYLLGSFSISQFGVNGFIAENQNTTKKISQELRLSSKMGGKLEWLLGGYYTHEDTSFHQNFPAVNTATGLVAGNWLYETFPSTYDEYAIFGDATYHFTPEFNVQIGGRESITKERTSSTTSGPYNSIFLGEPSPFVEPAVSVTAHAFTFLVTPQYKISRDLMVYARIASGFQAGGPNPAPGVPREYKPDTTVNYELGLKGAFLDHKLTIDASLYYISWKDIQLSLLSPAYQSYTGNGSAAKSEGVELSFEARPWTGFTVNAWGAYDNAVLTRNIPPASLAYGLAGDRLPFSSKYSGSLSLNQDFPLGDSVTGYVGGSADYVGDRKSRFNFTPGRQDLPAYTKIDLDVGARFGTWTANAYVSNVGNVRGVLDGGTGYLPPYAYVYIRPRTVGLSLSKTF